MYIETIKNFIDNFKKLIVFLIFILFLFIIIFYLNFRTISVENAIFNYNFISINSPSSGVIQEFNLDNFSNINQNEIIAKIYSKTFEEEYNDKISKLESLKQSYKNIKEDANLIETNIKTLEKDVIENKNKVEYANNDYVRYKNAFKDGSVTKNDLVKAEKNITIAKNRLLSSQNSLETSKNKLKILNSKLNSIDSNIKETISASEQIKSNIHTEIKSPISGIIKDKTLTTGDFINKDDKLVSIYSREFNIVANFQNKKNLKIKPKQKIIIKFNGYNKKITGTIIEIKNISEDDNTVKKSIKFNCSDKDIYNITDGTNAVLDIAIF